MSNGSGSGGSSVGIVAIIAILVLVGLGAWFAFGRPGMSTRQPAQTTAPAPDKSRIDVKVNLPDTVSINP
jgi:hypothetical protein